MMYTLLTGATGLVGRYLLRDLLLNEHRLAVVVRPSRRQSPVERMEEILQHWERELGRTLPRPVVLSGDICEPGFGLSSDDARWVRESCPGIIHSAAILEFYGSDRSGEPWRTNFNGTRHMIELCRELGIHDIHYVSTAYVAGYQTDPVMEDSLDTGQSFRNDYEESKFHAEKLVRRIDFADHVTVYRPAVISGDSRTGYTNTYHGIYLYLRLMAMIIPTIPPDEDGLRPTPIRLRMTGEERRNIVPVEWVSAVMTRLFETPEARGQTFHIAPDNPITSGRIIEYCEQVFGSKGAQFSDADLHPESRDENEDQWIFAQIYRENMATYAPYERTDNVFDLTNMKRFAADLVCPEIDLTVMRRYIDYGNEDRWGKRRPEYVEPSADIAGLLQDVLGQTGAAQSGDTSLPAGEQSVMGLDVTGVGGVQLTLTFSRQGLVQVERGLPRAAAPILSLSAEEFLLLLHGPAGGSIALGNAWESAGDEDLQQLTELLLGCLHADSTSVQAQPV